MIKGNLYKYIDNRLNVEYGIFINKLKDSNYYIFSTDQKHSLTVTLKYINPDSVISTSVYNRVTYSKKSVDILERTITSDKEFKQLSKVELIDLYITYNPLFRMTDESREIQLSFIELCEFKNKYLENLQKEYEERKKNRSLLGMFTH
jgi:hypothetical protein